MVAVKRGRLAGVADTVLVNFDHCNVTGAPTMPLTDVCMQKSQRGSRRRVSPLSLRERVRVRGATLDIVCHICI